MPPGSSPSRPACLTSCAKTAGTLAARCTAAWTWPGLLSPGTAAAASWPRSSLRVRPWPGAHLLAATTAMSKEPCVQMRARRSAVCHGQLLCTGESLKRRLHAGKLLPAAILGRPVTRRRHKLCGRIHVGPCGQHAAHARVAGLPQCGQGARALRPRCGHLWRRAHRQLQPGGQQLQGARSTWAPRLMMLEIIVAAIT